MSTPVLENIAANILTAVNAVTVGNGYNQTLTAMRSRRVDHSDFVPADGAAIIEQHPRPEPADSQRLGASDIEQVFLITVYVLDSDTAQDSVDTRRNQIYADICKELMKDRTRGGYANHTRVLPQVLADDEAGEMCAVIVPVVVHYSHSETDPYTGF